MIGANLSLWTRILASGFGLVPPPGFTFLSDIDGVLLTDTDGTILVEEI